MGAVVKQEGNNVVPADQFLMRAIESNAAPETIEKMMVLKERYEAGEARKAFFQAMQLFQEIKPELKRNTPVKYTTKSGGVTDYNFCPLSEIEKQLKEPLSQCNLSYRFENGLTEHGGFTVTCIVSHVAGHSERTTMAAPADGSGNKNAIQAIGSTSTYLMRYTLIAAFALTTADDDDDGSSNSDLPFQRVLEQNKLLQDANLLQAIVMIKNSLAHDDYMTAYETLDAMPDDTKSALWIAPTKGGIFTTREIAQMRSNEWGAARQQFHAQQEGEQ
jgi:hypothetical protein